MGLLTGGRTEAAFMTIDNPNPVLVRPLAGSITPSPTGEIPLDAGRTNLNASGTFFPLNSAGQALATTVGPARRPPSPAGRSPASW